MCCVCSRKSDKCVEQKAASQTKDVVNRLHCVFCCTLQGAHTHISDCLNFMHVCSLAENVQTNVVVVWLEKLGSELQDRGQTREAANCLRKAMYFFGAEKGEALAQVMIWRC